MANYFELKEHTLSIETVVAQMMHDEQFLAANWRIKEMKTELLRQMVWQLKAWFVTQELEEIKVPATWWDHFKLTFFGEYIEETIGFFGFKNVRYKNVAKMKAYYPEYPIPDLGTPYLKIVTEERAYKEK